MRSPFWIRAVRSGPGWGLTKLIIASPCIVSIVSPWPWFVPRSPWPAFVGISSLASLCYSFMRPTPPPATIEDILFPLATNVPPPPPPPLIAPPPISSPTPSALTPLTPQCLHQLHLILHLHYLRHRQYLQQLHESTSSTTCTSCTTFTYSRTLAVVSYSSLVSVFSAVLVCIVLPDVPTASLLYWPMYSTIHCWIPPDSVIYPSWSWPM